jgi:hypothetical protein
MGLIAYKRIFRYFFRDSGVCEYCDRLKIYGKEIAKCRPDYKGRNPCFRCQEDNKDTFDSLDGLRKSADSLVELVKTSSGHESPRDPFTEASSIVSDEEPPPEEGDR